MKRCRCCLQKWTLESFRVLSGNARRARCRACEAGCKNFAKRYYQRNRVVCLERTRAWKAALRADVIAIRKERAA